MHEILFEEQQGSSQSFPQPSIGDRPSTLAPNGAWARVVKPGPLCPPCTYTNILRDTVIANKWSQRHNHVVVPVNNPGAEELKGRIASPPQSAPVVGLAHSLSGKQQTFIMISPPRVDDYEAVVVVVVAVLEQLTHDEGTVKEPLGKRA